jgi:hypothetical protein
LANINYNNRIIKTVFTTTITTTTGTKISTEVHLELTTMDVMEEEIKDEDEYVRCRSTGPPEQDWRYDSTQNYDY